MGEKALWPTVAIVFIGTAAVTVMLLAGVEVVSIVALFSLAGNVIGLMLYGKVQKIEDNTNGTVTSLRDMVTDLIEHAKRTGPVESKEE